MFVGFKANEYLCIMKEVCTDAPFASICTIKRQNGFHHYSMGSVFFCLYPYRLSFFLLEKYIIRHL